MLYRSNYNSFYNGQNYTKGEVYEMDEVTAAAIGADPVSGLVEEKMVEKSKDKQVKKSKTK